MRVLMLSTALLLGGCGLGSGVVPIGPGIYGVSEMRAPVRGGGAAAHQAVMADAAGFCQQQGRHVAVLDLQPGGDPRIPEWPTAFGLRFRCT